jgi:hypothetical protein
MSSSTSEVACQEKELWELLTILCRKEKFDTVLSEKRQLVDAISEKKGSLAATSENIYQLAMRDLEELVEYMESESQKRGILTRLVITYSSEEIVIDLGESVDLLKHRFIEWTRKVLTAVDYGWSLNITGAGATDAKANVHSIVEEIAKAWTETVTVMVVALELSDKILRSGDTLKFYNEDGWVIFESLKNDQGIEEINFSDNETLSFLCYNLEDPQPAAPAIEATRKAIAQLKQVKSIMEAAALRFRLLMFPPYFTSVADM